MRWTPKKSISAFAFWSLVENKCWPKWYDHNAKEMDHTRTTRLGLSQPRAVQKATKVVSKDIKFIEILIPLISRLPDSGAFDPCLEQAIDRHLTEAAR